MSILLTMALMLPLGGQPPEHVKPPNQASRRGHVRPADRRWSVVRPFNGKLTRIARCESGLRWHIATGNGFFGGLQFTVGTWRSVGGRGMPHTNTPLEQKFRAVKVFQRRGNWGDWPVCGYR